ncbi:MAG: type II toxin-antitoxin system HicB family antitoxin [Pseudomonadales bacterium]|jgi:antitoxin HicB|nr:type II toxin-antitoxin system HicB family antitoxin [Pseudomonadales bacterium]
MEYVVNVETDEPGVLLTCPEVPEFHCGGDDLDDALLHALEMLETTFSIYMDARKLIPLPRKAKTGEITLRLPAQISAKVLLHNAMVTAGVRKVELSKRMGGLSGTQIERLLDLRHSTKLETLEAALAVVGCQLELSVS